MVKKERSSKSKKPFYKKWLFWVIAVLVIAVIGSATDRGGGTSADDKPDNSQQTVNSGGQGSLDDFDPDPNSVETEDLNIDINRDWEIITRSGHPTYYGSVEVSHSIWGDVERKKIIFADGYDKWGDPSILSMTAYRGSDLIRGIYVSFSNFDEPMEVTVDEILPVIASYMPYEIMDKYYQFKRSQLIVPDEAKDNKDKYYVISYSLTEDGNAAYYAKEHEYSGSIDVVIEASENGVVKNFDISFGTPRWMSSLSVNSMHQEEWACDLYDYRT